MKTLALAALPLAFIFYLFLYVIPALFHDALQLGVNQSGYCPYTLYQQYHPAEFNIPNGVCR